MAAPGLGDLLRSGAGWAPAEVPWSRIAAILAINRLCAPGSELAIEARWYASTALDDVLGVAPARVNTDRLYRCLDGLLPHKTALEQHLATRYGELFGAQYEVLLYDLTSTYVEHHLGELFPRVGVIVTTLTGTNRAVVHCYNQRGTAEQWIKEGREATH